MSNTNRVVPFNPKDFQLDATIPMPVRANRKGRQLSHKSTKFIAGPIDVRWLSLARKLGAPTLWVGLCLWYLKGLKRSVTFTVSNLTLEGWGVLPDAKSRALRKLEQVGLISVERRAKRTPRVTIVLSPEGRDGDGS